jgi:hypothetical protein
LSNNEKTLGELTPDYPGLQADTSDDDGDTIQDARNIHNWYDEAFENIDDLTDPHQDEENDEEPAKFTQGREKVLHAGAAW